MNRRQFLAACGIAAWMGPRADARTVFPIHYRQQPAYAPLLAFVEPGSDAFANEKRAMEIRATLLQAMKGELPVSPQVRGISPTPSSYNKIAPDVSAAVFAAQAGAIDLAKAWREWRASLGEVEAARFYPLPGDLVRYEVKSRVGQYRVGTWRVAWSDGKVQEFTPLAETLAHAPQTWFRDVTAHAFAPAPSFHEQLLHGVPYWRGRLDPACGIDLYGSHGVAVGDIDNDGWDELYVCQPGGLPNRLFKNDGRGQFRDITEASGVGLLDDTSCALFLDLRNSGHQDLVALRSSGPLLFLNDGKGKFTMAENAFRFANTPSGGFTGMAAADYDRDGRLDLYLCCYVYFQSEAQYRYPSPYHDAQNGPPNFLFRNQLSADGTGYFEDVTTRVGLDENNNRFSFAPAWCDYDGDGWPDLYVANDFGRNNLYRNQQGRFRDVAAQAGVEDMGPGMSAAWLDYDGDGKPDLYVANMWSDAGQRVVRDEHFRPSKLAADAYRRHTKGNSLYRNRGDGRFDEVPQAMMGRWAWAADGHDFDNDGLPELLITCGMLTNNSSQDLMSYFWRQVVSHSPTDAKTASPQYENGWNAINQLVREEYSWSGREPNVVYARRNGEFHDVSGISGLDFAADSRAFAVTDLDGDGYLDLVLKSRLGPQVRVLQNQCGQARPVAVISLRGVQSNRDAIGAKVEWQGQTKWVAAGSGYLSQHTKNLHFAVTGTGSLRITWPSGQKQEIASLAAGFRYVITEGNNQPQALPLRPYAALPDTKLPVSDNTARLHTTWLLEPVPLPEAQRGPALLLLRGEEPVAPPAGVPCEVIELSEKDPERATAYALFRRYLFDYRAPLETPFWLLLDEHGYARKVYASAPTAGEVKSDLHVVAQPLPFAGRYILRPKRDYYKLGAAFLGAGYSEQALPYLEETLRRTPDNARTLLAVGRVHFQGNRLPQARAALQRAVQLEPSLLEAYNEWGGVEAAAGDPALALQLYAKALALGPQVPHVLLNAAHAHEALKQPGDAEKLYQQVLTTDPDNSDAANGLGRLFAQQQRYNEARDLFQRALKAHRDDAQAINNLGVLYMQLGQVDDAVAAFRYGLQVAPGDDTLYMNLARIYARRNEFGKARSILEDLLARQPQHAAAKRALVELEAR